MKKVVVAPTPTPPPPTPPPTPLSVWEDMKWVRSWAEETAHS